MTYLKHPVERAARRSMITRCINPNATGYHNYGGRGITVCDRWRHGEDGKSGFKCFFEDMGPKPSPCHSIDRWPDNDGNYEPSNCRWATPSEQVGNRRDPKHKTAMSTDNLPLDSIEQRTNARQEPISVSRPQSAETIAGCPLPLDSIDPRTFMPRSQVAETLAACGFRVHPSTLASKVTNGGGPPFRKFGKTPMYLWADVVTWVKNRMGEAAVRHDTARPK